jgi:hypothetical protein
MSCYYLHGLQTVETLRPLARYTIQPLSLNMSEDETSRITTSYGRFSGPSNLMADSKGTLRKGKTIYLNTVCRDRS